MRISANTKVDFTSRAGMARGFAFGVPASAGQRELFERITRGRWFSRTLEADRLKPGVDTPQLRGKPGRGRSAAPGANQFTIQRFNNSTIQRCSPAFTLIEVLLALAISAIILAAIGGVFYSAIRLRDRTSAALDESAAMHQAFTILQRDFSGAILPGSTIPLAGDFKCQSLGSGNGGQAGHLQLFTTTGVINDRVPWGDIQEIFYELRDPTISSRNSTGRDLIRTITRNLLSTATQQSDEQWLMGNVQTFQISCFDGQNWRDNWDTSMGDTNLPLAVKIRVQVSADPNRDLRSVQPFELVVPILSVSHTNGQSTGSSGGAG